MVVVIVLLVLVLVDVFVLVLLLLVVVVVVAVVILGIMLFWENILKRNVLVPATNRNQKNDHVPNGHVIL